MGCVESNFSVHLWSKTRTLTQAQAEQFQEMVIIKLISLKITSVSIEKYCLTINNLKTEIFDINLLHDLGAWLMNLNNEKIVLKIV